jgi:type 1 glutamine amidotransferase
VLRAAAALLAGLAVALGAPAGAGAQDGPAPEVLLFTKTAGFRHDAIPAAVAALQARLGRAGLRATPSDDPAVFSDRGLRRFDAVVFLLTTGDVLAGPQEAAFARWVRAGGGWAGVHSAADTEYAWSFYGVLLAGASFSGHPPVQPGTVLTEDRTHPSTAHLPPRWSRTDEWYAFRANPRPRARVLLRVDERSYDPGQAAMGADHPIAWCSAIGRGHAWYTALGHTAESYREAALRRATSSTGSGRRPACGRPTAVPARHGGAPRS